MCYQSHSVVGRALISLEPKLHMFKLVYFIGNDNLKNAKYRP